MYFGFPYINENKESQTGSAKLYFKSIVKITEDFVSYDFLRYRSRIFTFIWDIMMFSMVAEIGGY